MTDSDTVDGIEEGVEEVEEGATVDDPVVGDGQSEDISSDVVYGLLADKRRRYLIHHLKQVDGPVSVGDLAEQVAAWENDKAVDEITSKERKRVYISIYQSHLPTLAKEGVVEYDEDRRVVGLSPSMTDREIYLEVVPSGSLPWSLFYVGLVVADAVLVVLAWLEVYPFDLVSGIGWAVVVLVTFAATATVQTLQFRRMRFGDEGPPPELR